MKTLEEIKADLSFIECFEVVVFGSYAEQRADRRSDIDIAVITREMNRKRCAEMWMDLLGGAPEVYDIKIFELLPLRIKASVIKRYEVVFGNRLDIPEYFYRFRKLWKDTGHRIEEVSLAWSFHSMWEYDGEYVDDSEQVSLRYLSVSDG